jgi:hypothetical protein
MLYEFLLLSSMVVQLGWLSEVQFYSDCESAKIRQMNYMFGNIRFGHLIMFYSSRCALQRSWRIHAPVPFSVPHSTIRSNTFRRSSVSYLSQRRYSSYPDRNSLGVGSFIQFPALTVNEHDYQGVHSEVCSPLRGCWYWALFLFPA